MGLSTLTWGIDLLKSQGKGRAIADFALDVQPGIIGIEYALDDRQSQTGSTGLGGEEGIEYGLQSFLWNSASRITDLDAGLLVLQRMHLYADDTLTINCLTSI